ncbi:MAG: hypothetical protein ACOX4B_08575 [Bacillota bacterium]
MSPRAPSSLILAISAPKGHGDPGIELVDVDVEHAVAQVLGFYGGRSDALGG